MNLVESEKKRRRYRPFPMPESDPRWQQIDAKLPHDDHARIVKRQVQQLDRDVVDQLYRQLGKLAYDPIILLAMVIYEYLKGRQSPANWEEEARLNEAMQWLGYGYTPARRTWYDFRDRIGDGAESGATHEWHSHMRNYFVSKELSPFASRPFRSPLGCIMRL